ncbi:MAG: hypothetical protein IPL61_27260 [Myxococcales bacterium]|nr:hypothetical protein [Myxococcales bacterium]
MTIAQVQAVFDGRSRHAAAARAACRAGTWPSFLAATAPARPGIFGPGRGEHARCLKLAAELFAGPQAAMFDVIPVWVCQAYEEPEDGWVRGHVARVDDEPWSLTGVGGLYHKDAPAVLDARTTGRGRSWNVGQVVETRAYAPDIPLALRGQRFGVIGGTIFEVEVIDAVRGVEVPAPTLEVPAYCTWVRARIEGLEAVDLRAIEALSITVDDDGDLID